MPRGAQKGNTRERMRLGSGSDGKDRAGKDRAGRGKAGPKPPPRPTVGGPEPGRGGGGGTSYQGQEASGLRCPVRPEGPDREQQLPFGIRSAGRPPQVS